MSISTAPTVSRSRPGSSRGDPTISQSSRTSRSQSVPTLPTTTRSGRSRSKSRDTAYSARSQSAAPSRSRTSVDTRSTARSTPPTSRSHSSNLSRSTTKTSKSGQSSRPRTPATTASLASAINTLYTHLGSITFDPENGTAPWNAPKGTMSFSTLGGDARRCQSIYTELTGDTSQPSHKPNISLSNAVNDVRSGLEKGTFDEKTTHDDFKRYMRHVANFSNDLKTHRDANRRARKAGKGRQSANTSEGNGNSVTAGAGAKSRNRGGTERSKSKPVRV